MLIDLRQFNHSKLKEFCDANRFDYDLLLSYKEQEVAKLWIDKNTCNIVAFNLKKDPIPTTTFNFLDTLKTIQPISQSKKQKTKLNPLNLDLDSILDKISKFGINSLHPDEKKFLDNLK